MANRDDIDPPDASRQRGMIPADELTFRPQVRWRIWIPVLVGLVTIVAVYFVVETRRARRLRAQLLAEHALLTESLAPPYRHLRSQIESLTFGAVGAWQGTYTAPGFTMADLAREPVLYGRVRLGEIHRVEDVPASIRHRYADQLAACLGVETHAVHQLYSKGDFLMPSYVDSVRGVESGDRLAALRQDLQFRLRRDTPDLVQWSRRRYFVLAMDEAALSIDGPTRLYVWDLRDGRPVFRTRGEGNETVIIPVRIAGMPGGGRPVPQPTGRLNLAQHDCAVANQARMQLGVEVLSMRNAPRPEAVDADGGGEPSDAATADSAQPATPSPTIVDAGSAR